MLKRTFAVVVCCAILCDACGSQVPGVPSPIATVVATNTDAHGQVVDRYGGGGGIPQASVCVFFVPCVKADRDGRFTVPGQGMKTFDVYVGADGFSWVVLTATGPDLGQIALAPLTTDYVWSGIFQDPSLGPGFNERLISFDTHHAGPVTLSIHAGCSTAGTYEPLVLSVYPAGELDITRVLLGASLGSEVDRDASVERILPPAAYSAHMLFVGQNRGTCPWSMTIRHPV